MFNFKKNLRHRQNEKNTKSTKSERIVFSTKISPQTLGIDQNCLDNIFVLVMWVILHFKKTFKNVYFQCFWLKWLPQRKVMEMAA